MFYRNRNLRRVTGLLAIVLAVLPGIQLSHAFCYVAGCNSDTVRIKKTDQKSVKLAGDCSCSRSCKIPTKVSGSTASGLAAGEGVDEHRGSCPCPPMCWCHQLPEPLGLPTSAPVRVDQLSEGMGQYLAPMIQPSCCGQGLLYDSKATTDASISTVLLRCAELCRFLI